ncbi:Proteasome-associated ATPase, partial [Dissostichus eleginoides]
MASPPQLSEVEKHVVFSQPISEDDSTPQSAPLGNLTNQQRPETARGRRLMMKVWTVGVPLRADDRWRSGNTESLSCGNIVLTLLHANLIPLSLFFSVFIFSLHPSSCAVGLDRGLFSCGLTRPS